MSRYDRSSNGIGVCLFGIIICAVIFIITAIVDWQQYIAFQQNCGSYLKLAADANTVELAKERLSTAIKYLEDSNLTKGNTGTIYNTPETDIKVWYDNLVASENELEKIKTDASQFEKTNVLMKLRETLLDHGEKGDSITVPNFLHLYPNQASFFWTQVLSAGFGCLILVFIGLVYGQ